MSPETSTTWAQRRALSMIRAYQRAFEGRPSPCRFFPSCSSYAHEAFERHGAAHGGWLTFRRLLRCRPLGPSGFDPVPDECSARCRHQPVEQRHPVERRQSVEQRHPVEKGA